MFPIDMLCEVWGFFAFEETHNCFPQTINFNLVKEKIPLDLKIQPF